MGPACRLKNPNPDLQVLTSGDLCARGLQQGCPSTPSAPNHRSSERRANRDNAKALGHITVSIDKRGPAWSQRLCITDRVKKRSASGSSAITAARITIAASKKQHLKICFSIAVRVASKTKRWKCLQICTLYTTPGMNNSQLEIYWNASNDFRVLLAHTFANLPISVSPMAEAVDRHAGQ